MARSRESKIELTAYDDLFQTDESREEAKLSKIRDIPIAEIDEFPDHPFKVLMDEDMEQLVDSIKRNGIMTPATVRVKEDGRYELISGHRRKKACELAGLNTLKCEVKELTRDEAIIIMVESNLQRSTILPSEKAFAYKMRLEAMKRQAGRPPKENASPSSIRYFCKRKTTVIRRCGSLNRIFLCKLGCTHLKDTDNSTAKSLSVLVRLFTAYRAVNQLVFNGVVLVCRDVDSSGCPAFLQKATRKNPQRLSSQCGYKHNHFYFVEI